MKSKQEKLKKLPSVLHRFSIPNSYDHAPQGTQCVVTEAGTKTVYVQKSDDEEIPCWVPLEDYKSEEKTLLPLLLNEDEKNKSKDKEVLSLQYTKQPKLANL